MNVWRKLRRFSLFVFCVLAFLLHTSIWGAENTSTVHLPTRLNVRSNHNSTGLDLFTTADEVKDLPRYGFATGVYPPPPCTTPLTFRYGFEGGGYGDCLKGLLAVAQMAYAAGCPFAMDFSRHPFGRVLPFIPTLLCSPEVSLVPDSDSRMCNMGDWSLREDTRATLNRVLSYLPSQSPELKRGLIVRANQPISRELALALKADEEKVLALARLLLSSFYTHVVDGSILGTYWPLSQPTSHHYRVGIHVRMGDMFVAGADWNKNDQRVGDMNELKEALRLIKEFSTTLSNGLPLIVFACADTTEALSIVREALAPLELITSPFEPIHIAYANTYVNSSFEKETLSVAREHHTLSNSNAVFIASNSGFAKTACAIAQLGPFRAACLQRAGATWEEYTPGVGVFSIL